MKDKNCLYFSSASFETTPFPHFCTDSILSPDIATDLFSWFESTNEWDLSQTEFYEQYEFSFFDIDFPNKLIFLKENEAILSISNYLQRIFDLNTLKIVGITAHKLIDGQKIGIHNDFIGAEESHRMIIQINPYWTESNGGYLMLFHSSNAEDVSKIIKPLNNTAFGFEISDMSNHAVSRINDFSRYSLVYTYAENV